MKKILLFLCIALPAFRMVAQTSPAPCCDPAVCHPVRCDSGWVGSPHLPYLLSVHQADVLSGLTVPQPISPTGPKICFDKIIKVETTANGQTAFSCIYINTKTGLIAQGLPQKHDPGICDIKPEERDFLLQVTSLKGNAYTYRNAVNNRGITEHWVQTANSETYQLSATGTGGPRTTVQRKPERRSYCDNKVKAQLYKVDGSTGEWFLFGKTYPSSLVLQKNKYLGNMGVGYQQTDKGLFIIMEMSGGAGFESRILDIRDQLVCFETAGFRVFEEEQQSSGNASLHAERERIRRDAAKPEKFAACQEKKDALIRFRNESLDKRERNLRQVRRGNAQENEATIKAQGELMDYDDMLGQLRLETELRKCRAEADQAEHPSADLQKEINCLTHQLATIRNVQTKFSEIDTRHRGQENLKKMEKSKQFMQVLSPCE